MKLSAFALVGAVMPVYIAQSAIGGLTFVGLPAYLREAGIGLEYIGLVFLFMVPWAAKFLWAGWFDRLRISLKNDDQYIDISPRLIVIGQLVMGCMILAIFGGLVLDWPIHVAVILFVVLTIVAATVDIVCDGFLVDQMHQGQSKWGSFGQVGGSYIGFALGGGGLLWVVGQSGWLLALGILALGVCMASLPLRVIFGDHVPPAEQRTNNQFPGLRAAFAKPGVPIGILIVCVVQLQGRMLQSLQGPLLVDAGLSLEQIGFIAGFGGALAGMLGTCMGLLIARLLQLRDGLIFSLLLQSLIAGCFYLLTGQKGDFAMETAAVSLAQSAVFAMIFTLLYAAMLEWAVGPQSGVDFTLFQSVDAVVGALGGMLGGGIAGYVGYAEGFVIIAIIGLCAVMTVTFCWTRLIRARRVSAA